MVLQNERRTFSFKIDDIYQTAAPLPIVQIKTVMLSSIKLSFKTGLAFRNIKKKKLDFFSFFETNERSETLLLLLKIFHAAPSPSSLQLVHYVLDE